MRLATLVLLTACGTTAGTTTMDTSTSFQVTTFSGNGPSPLDALQGQTIDFSIHWDMTPYNGGDGDDPAGCRTLGIGYGPDITTRTAHGATAALVQSQILDQLDNWDIRLQLCDAGQSRVVLESVIDALNLAFGCVGVPPSAIRRDATGSPELTSFTATQCSATILDVVNNRVLGNDNFAMTIRTGMPELP